MDLLHALKQRRLGTETHTHTFFKTQTPRNECRGKIPKNTQKKNHEDPSRPYTNNHLAMGQGSVQVAVLAPKVAHERHEGLLVASVRLPAPAPQREVRGMPKLASPAQCSSLGQWEVCGLQAHGIVEDTA